MRASSVLPSAKRPPSAVEAASPFAFAPAARRTEAPRPATGAERERRARPRGPLGVGQICHTESHRHNTVHIHTRCQLFRSPFTRSPHLRLINRLKGRLR